MILEIATISIDPQKEGAFEQALDQAQSILTQAEGYLGHEFQSCVEESGQYVLLIRWESLEAHTEGFRKSPLFTKWRALIGGFFLKPPSVLHYSTINPSQNPKI